MFKISQSKSYFWPVPIEAASEKYAGKRDKQTLELEFKRLSETESSSLIERFQAGEIKGLDLIKEIVVGWRNVIDDGKQLDFSMDLLTQIIDSNGGASLSIIQSFAESRYGAVSKN